MIETKINWHKASEELPDKSCSVIVACEKRNEIYHIGKVDFSVRHKLFNCHDFDNCPSNYFDNDVKYWAYFDELENALDDKEKDR